MSEAPVDYAERSLRYGKDQLDQFVEQTSDFVRENPTRALAYGVAAGFLLDRLPIFKILRMLLRLVMMALKPAVLIYGATKLYHATREEE